MPGLWAKSLGLAAPVPAMSRGRSQDLLILTGPVGRSLRGCWRPCWELGTVPEQRGGSRGTGRRRPRPFGDGRPGNSLWSRGTEPQPVLFLSFFFCFGAVVCWAVIAEVSGPAVSPGGCVRPSAARSASPCLPTSPAAPPPGWRADPADGHRRRLTETKGIAADVQWARYD